jgi:hypothetical protein
MESQAARGIDNHQLFSDSVPVTDKDVIYYVLGSYQSDTSGVVPDNRNTRKTDCYRSIEGLAPSTLLSLQFEDANLSQARPKDDICQCAVQQAKNRGCSLRLH